MNKQHAYEILFGLAGFSGNSFIAISAKQNIWASPWNGALCQNKEASGYFRGLKIKSVYTHFHSQLNQLFHLFSAHRDIGVLSNFLILVPRSGGL